MAQSTNQIVQNALLATNENWVTMHGTHVLIDDDGMPSKKTPIGRTLRSSGAAKMHRWYKGQSKSVFAAGVAGASSRASEGGRSGKAGIKTLKDMRSVAKKMGGVAVKEWNKAARKHGLNPIKNNKEKEGELQMISSTNPIVQNALNSVAMNAKYKLGQKVEDVIRGKVGKIVGIYKPGRDVDAIIKKFPRLASQRKDYEDRSLGMQYAVEGFDAPMPEWKLRPAD